MPLGRLQPELVSHVLSYSTRWVGVSVLQLICHEWRLLCRRVAFGRLALVTASRANTVVAFDAAGRERATLPALPWRKGTRVDPAAAGPRPPTCRTGAVPRHDDWPTCTLATPRRLYVSQYKVCGVLIYAVEADGSLQFHGLVSTPLLEYPEGLAVSRGPTVNADVLWVATCRGSVSSFDTATGSMLFSLQLNSAASPAEPLTAWNMTSRAGCLYVAAHLDGYDDVGDYATPTRDATGVVIRCALSACRTRIQDHAVLVANLNRPSGIVVSHDSILVTTYVEDEAKSTPRRKAWKRRVAVRPRSPRAHASAHASSQRPRRARRSAPCTAF
ncbi:hypothetical protein M885DRAFT_526080 [Pelagophyceae sp. CCMP2097]|nr:hypothetical protein M885DRAFT_526080 [Pelagophyceae sp. CCMP2097]